MIGFCRNVCGPSHKELPNITGPQAFFILYVFLERKRCRGSPISLSLPLVSLVSPNRERARDGLCYTCSSPLKTSSNPVNSKCACKIWQRKKYHECEQETLLKYKQHEGKKIICADGKSNTNWSQWVKTLCPFLSTDRTTQTH